MGEVLRAIMEHNCLDSRVAFYAFDVSTQAVGGATRQFTRKPVALRTKADTWFLMMGWSQDNSLINPGVDGFWQFKNFPSAFAVARASTGESYQLPPVLQGLQNYNLNNFATLDEYILWAPGETILVSQDVNTQTIGGAPITDVFLTFQGVEFKMPPERGFSYGQ